METQQHQSHILKGKRTKRPRSSSPAATAASSSSSGGGTDSNTNQYLYSSTEEEEEDMAYCLILLAQGHGKPPPLDHDDSDDEKISSRKFFHVSTATANKAGFFVYECKTCNRSFPSFQALGGHRASHKKPKSDDDVKRLSLTIPIEDRDFDLDDSQLNPTNKASSSKAKVHECSICGSEFNSGQALGGHMRRHRSNTNNQAMNCAVDQAKPFALDLNLPAPEDDSHHREPKFQFPATQQALVFSAPALVDCYY